jgi:uncharacterized protein (DUF362 family)
MVSEGRRHVPAAVAEVGSPDDYGEALRHLMEITGAITSFDNCERIIVKPNVVNASLPPVTTDVRCVAALVDWLKENAAGREIVIAEGSGEGDTIKNMKKNGYGELGVPLVDLDREALKPFSHPAATILKEVHLPEILDGAALISVPVAKDHSLAGVTLGLKNMIGCLPAEHFGGFWSYKKSKVHRLGLDGLIADLILYLEPAFTVLDARLGLKGGHLGGEIPAPPIGRVVAGTDVVEVDRLGAGLLGHDSSTVGYLSLAEKLRSRR